MAQDSFGIFQEAAWNAIRSAVRVGVVGRANADGTTTVTVDGRPHYIYVRTGATATGGEIVEAFNKGIPRLAGAPVLLVKWNRTWTVIGVDADSPAVTAETYSVAYHTHLRDNGLNQSVHDLDGMPSSIAGRAGALLRVNDDEDGYYLADSASGGTGTVDSVNTFTGDVILDADDIAETAGRIWFTTAEETKLAGIEALADVTDAANVGAAINSAAADTPLDADKFGFWDVVDSALKSVTWANIKATLKTYFDTLYVALTGNQTVAGIKTFSDQVKVETTSSDPLAVEVNGTFARFQFTSYRDVAASHGIFSAKAARGSKAIPTAIQSGDQLFAIRVEGYSTAFGVGNTAAIEIEADGVHTGTSLPGRISLWTTPVGAVLQVERVRITESGHVGIGTTAPQGKLHIHDGAGGRLFVTKTGVNATPQTIIPDGAGDVVRGAFLSLIANDGTSVASTGQTFVEPGFTTAVSVSGTTATVTINANGSVTIVRTAGSGTLAVTIDMFWQ